MIKIQEEPIWRTMWGPCFGHKRAIFWPFLGKVATGYTQQYEIWHGTSLGTLIEIQEKQIWRTMWGPCFGQKRAIFWPFLGKGDYGINPEFWNLAWSIPGHIDYKSGRTNLRVHVRTMFEPKNCHILPISGITDSQSGKVETRAQL